MRRTRRLLLPLYMMLSACMPMAPSETPTRAASMTSTLPAMKTFSVPRPVPAVRSNADIARDFLDLTFRLESGRALPGLSRFEGPITVRVNGDAPPQLDRDLKRLLHRLRSEARLDIHQVDPSQAASVTIHAVSTHDIRRALPMAACFVVPNVSSLGEYKRMRRSSKLNWGQITRREKVAIFVPNDSTPQEMRDCLHEELAQSLGPLNDLYRLSDSVFNDDNVHTVLTGFDMLILRATYDGALRPGMTRGQVAARLPGILARINPRGANGLASHLDRTPRVWIDAVQTALGPGASPGERQRAATEALKVASAMGWQDHRRAFSHYARGRILLASDPDQARAEFEAAGRFYRQTPWTALHQAYVASRYENAALLATLLLIRAEALDLMGRVSEAREVRMDSLGWARYGFGADWAVRAKLREIAALSPLKGPRG